MGFSCRESDFRIVARPLETGFSKEVQALSRSVVQNQLLFTAGYALTTGGFLTYFAADLGATTRTIAWVLVIPELVGVLAVFTPWLLRQVAIKKTLFLTTSLLARGCMLLVPFSLWISETSGFPLLLTGLILANILQAVSYTAYLSWLSDLAPEQSWGRFFARRNMAHTAILLFLPFLAALLRDYLRKEVTTDWLLEIYTAIFCLGNLLQLLSLWPMLRWPASLQVTGFQAADFQASQTKFRENNPPAETIHWPVSKMSFGYLLLFSWWLAVFQGITQTAFFLHSYRQLELSLSGYYALTGLMYLLQMATIAWAGRRGDRAGYRQLLMVSTAVVGCSMWCWLGSLSGNWLWLWGAYALWGGFGAVNLALQNLTLSIVPRFHNTWPIALQRFSSGGLAGLAGLAGGYWLGEQLEAQTVYHWGDWTFSPFFVLFAISLLGRLLAPLWLLGVTEPEKTSNKNPPVL